jgi:uncharacterized protein YndB with AHSA1/START domain
MTEHTMNLARTIDAPVERVYDAWLSPSWGEWAGPAGSHGKVTLMEPQVGGRYRMVMHAPNGMTLAIGGVYRVLERPAKIVMSWKWEHEDEETLVTLTFTPLAGGKTALTVLHEGFGTQERHDDHARGWAGTVDRLAAKLAGAA